jgi:hypothetical protein
MTEGRTREESEGSAILDGLMVTLMLALPSAGL